MVEVRKTIPRKEVTSVVASFLSNRCLETYLKKFEISKELFFEGMIKTDEDVALLERYYLNSCNKASRLVMDDEYVGITFDNLDVMSKVIKQNKHVK